MYGIFKRKIELFIYFGVLNVNNIFLCNLPKNKINLYDIRQTLEIKS